MLSKFQPVAKIHFRISIYNKHLLGLAPLQHLGQLAPVQLTLNHAGDLQKSFSGNPGISHFPSPPLATAVRRKEEAVHRSAVPHERRVAGRSGVHALRSDGLGPGEQQERHPA